MPHIRPLQEEDLASLLALYRHLHVDDEPPPAGARLAPVWHEYMSNPRITCFGAFTEQALVSSATLVVIPNLTRGGKPYGLIENVVTHAQHRGRGHASAVLQAARAHAWNAGCYKLMLLTSRKDPGTLRFYQSAGFSADGKQGFIARPPDQGGAP